MKWLERRREQKRREQEIVGTIWVWDSLYPMTRKMADHFDYTILPFGWAIISDDRRRR